MIVRDRCPRCGSTGCVATLILLKNPASPKIVLPKCLKISSCLFGKIAIGGVFQQNQLLGQAIGVCIRCMFQPSNPNIDAMKACSGTASPSNERPNAWPLRISRVTRVSCPTPVPSEPDVKVTLHPAQAVPGVSLLMPTGRAMASDASHGVAGGTSGAQAAGFRDGDVEGRSGPGSGDACAVPPH